MLYKFIYTAREMVLIYTPVCVCIIRDGAVVGRMGLSASMSTSGMVAFRLTVSQGPGKRGLTKSSKRSSDE